MTEIAIGASIIDRIRKLEKRIEQLESADKAGPVFVVKEQSSTPTLPGSNIAKLYTKNSGGRSKLYIADDVGEDEVGSSGVVIEHFEDSTLWSLPSGTGWVKLDSMEVDITPGKTCDLLILASVCFNNPWGGRLDFRTRVDTTDLRAFCCYTYSSNEHHIAAQWYKPNVTYSEHTVSFRYARTQTPSCTAFARALTVIAFLH